MTKCSLVATGSESRDGSGSYSAYDVSFPNVVMDLRQRLRTECLGSLPQQRDQEHRKM